MISTIIIYGLLVSASILLPESYAAEEPQFHQEQPAPADIPKDIPPTIDATIAKKDDVPPTTEATKIYHGNFTLDDEEVPRTGALKLNLGALLNGGLQINKKVNVGLPSFGITVNKGVKIEKPVLSSSAKISDQVSVGAPAIVTQVKAGVEVPAKVASAPAANTIVHVAPQAAPLSTQQQVGVNVNVAADVGTAEVSTPTTSMPLFAHAGLTNVHLKQPIKAPAVPLSSVSQTQLAQSVSLPAASLTTSVGGTQQAQPLTFPAASLSASVGQPQQVQNGIRSPYSLTIGAPMGEAVQVSEVGTYVDSRSPQVTVGVQSNVQTSPPPSAFQEAVNGGRFIGGLKGKGAKFSLNLNPQTNAVVSSPQASFNSHYAQAQAQQFSGLNTASASVSTSVNVSPQVQTAVQGSYGDQPGGSYGSVADGSYVSQSGPSYVHTHAVPIEFDNQEGQVGISFQEPNYGSSIGASNGIDTGLGISFNLPSLSASIGASKQIDLGYELGKSFNIEFGK